MVPRIHSGEFVGISNILVFGELALANHTAFCHIGLMSHVAELLKEASKLDRIDRAELISSLLEDLDPNPHYVTDEEAMQRLEDLKSGRVKGLSEAEFWKACGRS